ncbi:MAG: hypothetical protein JW966_00360 [Anaerolineae bacterium]|nr:hypothetical protein [Anaerolineae bacterium]
MPGLRTYFTFGALALVLGGLLALVIDQPGYTDAYYYYNAGERLAQGDGLTDAYLWTYISAPDSLPGPSHAYWMPLESLVAGGSMAVLGTSFGAAQVPSVLCFAGLVVVAVWVGASLGQTRRHAWTAGLLALFSGFYTPFWTTTDTFALFGLVGALALVCIGLGRQSGRWYWFALGGVLCGLAHLTRADGLLFVMVLVLVAAWPRPLYAWRVAVMGAVVGTAAYLMVMTPWFVRNLHEIDSVLPTGGTQTVWLRGYDELVNYPAGTSAADFFDWGLVNILQSRWEAFANNLGTFVAVETWVVLGPFVLLGLWQRRRVPLVLGVIIYALGLHLAMTVIFAYPGYRGGLFHSAAALLPFWAGTGVIGLDEGIAWMAKRRRWRRVQAQKVFAGALVVLAAVLSLGITAQRLPDWNDSGKYYAAIVRDLPPDAVLMVNDPAALYYFTGYAGVVVPNASPDVVPDIAERYGVTHLVLDVNRTAPFSGLFLGTENFPFLRLVQVHGTDTLDRADDRLVFEIVKGETD